MSMDEFLFGDKEPEWHDLEISVECPTCREDLSGGRYHNEKGVLKTKCSDGHEGEIYIGQGVLDG